MNIVIFGYYNALNAGDDRIQYCLTRALRSFDGHSHTIVFLPHFMKPEVKFLRSFDWAVIGGGGLVFEKVGIWKDLKNWIDKSHLKIGVVGLGITRLPDGLDKELNSLLEKAQFFHVRDSTSKSLLNDDVRVTLSPDLTWMFPYSTDEKPHPETIALNLAPCPWKQFNATKWVEALEKEDVRPFPLFFAEERDEGLLRSFYGELVPHEWDVTPLIESEILVASRFHAIIFAMQLRRPFIAINYDEKIERLLTEANLQDCLLETDQSDQLTTKIEWLRSNKTTIIARIDHFASQQESRGKQFLQSIRQEIARNLPEAVPKNSISMLTSQFSLETTDESNTEYVRKRKKAAQDLTKLMTSQRPFSFLRLGDGEVNWILRMQGDTTTPRLRYNYPQSRTASVEVAYSVTGLEPCHYTRLMKAYNNCTYLDLYNIRPAVRDRLPQLNLERAPESYQNYSPDTSIIFYEWTYYEMGRYLSGRRCLFAGGESLLLEALWKNPEYRKIATRYWPSDAQPFFTDVRENGRNYSENLDGIKEDLKQFIQANQIDTLFLSLATGAKIICYELANELGICCYDFGSMTRGLTYAASPGYHAMRSFHNPYFFTLPLQMYVEALEIAYPQMPEIELVAKAQGQLCFDLQRKEVMKSFATDAADPQNFVPSKENLELFASNLSYYNTKFYPLFGRDKEARQLDREFRNWCRKKGLGIEGLIFQSLVKVKGGLRRLFDARKSFIKSL